MSKAEKIDLKIAVVDDEKDLSDVISKVLQKLGYSAPTVFSDSTTLIRALMTDHQNFDIILMDYRMPEMNGIEAAKIIKRYNKENNLVVMSGYDFVKDKAADIGLPFLPKPFSIEQLDLCLNNLEIPISSA